MVRLGELKPEEAVNHPDKNIITRAVGTGEDVKIDFFDVKLESGDQILICSDGLTNMVSDRDIYEILRSARGRTGRRSWWTRQMQMAERITLR